MANDKGDSKRKAPKDRARPAPAPAPAEAQELEGETGASRLPSTPVLIGIAAVLGIVVGGVPVLIFALTRGEPPPPVVTTAPAKKLTDEESLRQRAEAGDGQAMVKLGRGLFEGTWGRRDEKEAERWLGRAIESRNPVAVDEANLALEELRSFVRARRFERESEAAEEHEPPRSPRRTPPDAAEATPPVDAPPAQTPSPEPAPAPAPVAPRPISEPEPAPAPVADEAAEEAEPEEAAEAEQGAAGNPAQVAALERDLRKRVASWFKARDPAALTCRDCTGRKEVACPRCDGSSRAPCPQCNGAATIQIVETVPGRSVTGVRTVRRRVDCPTCETGDVTCRCEDGKVTCECAEAHEGVAGGYREVSGRKAFWDFISPTARRGKKQDALFPAVIRGDELADHRGVSVGVVDAVVQQVTIERDRATVLARVTYVGQNGARTEDVESRSVWIRDRGKFYLLTPADTSPERLLRD